jgi:hypothetical protein
MIADVISCMKKESTTNSVPTFDYSTLDRSTQS